MPSACKGREVSFNAHVIFIIGSKSPLFDNADFVWRNTILTLQLRVFSNGGGRGWGEARVALMPPVADPGEGPGGPPPLFLDQTGPERSKKKLRPGLPLISGSGWPPPPPPPRYPKVWIRRWPRWDYLLLPELKVSLKQNGAFYRVTMDSKFLHGQINFSFSIKCIQDAHDCNNRRKVDDRFPCIMVTGLTGFSFCTRNFVFYWRQNL